MAIDLLRSHLDLLWRKIVVIGGKCVRCGGWYGLEAHHIFGRRYKGLVWDLDNGLCLCGECHKIVQLSKIELIKIIGQERYDRLEVKKREIKHWTLEELKNKENELIIFSRQLVADKYK